MVKLINSHIHRNTHISSDTPLPWSTGICSQMSYKKWWATIEWNFQAMLLLEYLPAHKMPLCSSGQTSASLNLPPPPLSDRIGECHSRDLIISETVNQRGLWGQCRHKKTRTLLCLSAVSHLPTQSEQVLWLSRGTEHILWSLVAFQRQQWWAYWHQRWVHIVQTSKETPHTCKAVPPGYSEISPEKTRFLCG